MGLLSSNKENQATMSFGDDYRFETKKLEIQSLSVVKYKLDGRKDKAWPIRHETLKRFEGLKGASENVLMVCDRDIILDPLHEIPDDYKKEIGKNMSAFAKDEEHKAYAKEGGDTLSKSTLLLSIAAAILIISIALIGVLKYYAAR